MTAYAFGDSVWPGLAKLNEECGEVLQVIGKIMMVHGGENHWSGNLREMLCDEIADLAAAIEFVKLYAVHQDEADLIEQRAREKLEKFINWHTHPEDDVPPERPAR